MESNDDLIEKQPNNETKKFYKTKTFWIIIILLCIIVGVILIVVLRHKFKIDFNYKIIPSELGSQNILVNWDANEIVNISIKVKGVENEIIRTYNICNSTVGEKLVKVYFGLPKIYIKVEKPNFTLEINKEFQIPAKELVIAPIQGTLAPLMLSLEIFNIKKNFSCPIYVALERVKTWNWSKLPERVYFFDIMDENILNSLELFGIFKFLDKLKIWMKQMFQVNNSTIFNLFINDYHNYIIPICLYANNIPSDNYKIYMLSDGAASYTCFNDYFDNKTTYVENYNKLKKKYLEFKDFVWSQKKYDRRSTSPKNIGMWDLGWYIYIILKVEKNTFWWLTKIKGVFAPNNPEALQELLDNKNISTKDIKNLFKSLDDKQKETIKYLFNFNSNYFEEAYKKNKTAMVIVGTYDNQEHNFFDYCITTELFYKDEYIYYYKPHPATPIETDKKKIEELKKYNITPIDSNVPFEMIIYYNPNISCSGYYSSSFIEVGKQNLKALFEQYKKEDEYYNRFDYFCQFIKKDDKKYGQYLKDNNNGTVLEINKKKLIEFKYDFGIYLKNNKTIEYYNYNESLR